MNELIKKANAEHFEKMLLNKRKIEIKVNETKHMVQHFLPHLIAAKDLTNENIPLSVEKVGDNLYEFSREIPEKLVFKTYEDALAFIDCWKYYSSELYYFVDNLFTPLPDTEIVSFSIDIESLTYDVQYIMPHSQRCLLSLTCIGIPFAIYEYMNELKLKNIVLNKGLAVTIKGKFKTIVSP